MQTRAERDGDRYRLFGRKIFITWGDHDMTDNIVHLVLARGPDAPPGVKGISLFVVPKYRVKADGTLGERNDIRPVSVEHKLGLHASPTCVMALGDHGGAEGFLIGRLHEGIACMFTMMNHMRVSVGLQGVGLADRVRRGDRVARLCERRGGHGGQRDGALDDGARVRQPALRNEECAGERHSTRPARHRPSMNHTGTRATNVPTSVGRRRGEANTIAGDCCSATCTPRGPG